MSAISLPDVEPVAEAAGPPDSGAPFDAVPFRLFGLEFSLQTASLDALEQVARSISRERLKGWFASFTGTEEVAMLSTCHRVELTLLVRSTEELDRWREALPGPRNSWRLREGHELVRHLFRVAAGRESLARGEGEVRHQVRSASGRVESRHPRAVLRQLLRRAVAAAEEVSPSVPLSQSIAAAAAGRLLDMVDRPDPRVLVIGSGTVGRQVVESLSSFARITVLFHRNPPEEEFLRATGAKAERLDRLSEELGQADAVITAAKFGDRGLRGSDLPRTHPLLLVDLGMPRNIDPDVRELPNVHLVDLEDLYAARVATNDGPDHRLEELADRCSERLESSLLEPWVNALRRAAEELRRSELEGARRFLGNLDPDQEYAIERLTHRLVARLLLAPTRRLRSLSPGPEGDLQRRLAVELFRPLPPEP